MVAMIARLIETGNAYEADGHVLSRPSDPDYGALGRRDRDAMIAGARVEVAAYKQDPADFVLWKPSPDGVIGWESPWGRGRPGWHIECSAMIEAHLGETIDIHGGGLDLIFPHHENEIAQSRCAHSGTPLARYWVHNGFLSMAGDEKMSKSLGNVVLVNELLNQGWDGEVHGLRFERALSPATGMERRIAHSVAKDSDRLYRSLGKLSAIGSDRFIVPAGFEDALADDLNTPRAFAELHKIQSDLLEGRTQDAYEKLRPCGRLLGILQHDPIQWARKVTDPAYVEEAVFRRSQAKLSKDFEKADQIRATLAEQGIILEDNPDGTTDWRRA